MLSSTGIPNSFILFLNKEDFSILSVFGLLVGLSWSISLIIPDNYLEKNAGIGEYFPSTTAEYNPSISSALKGGSSVHIS